MSKLQKRILLVDDNSTLRKLRLQVLQVHGFEAHAVSSGEEAFQACAAEQYDLVLVDLSAGTKASTDLCEDIKSRHPQQLVAILATSFAYITSSCPDEVINKDDGPEHLVHEVRQAIGATN